MYTIAIRHISCRILYTSCDWNTSKICSHQRVSKVLCVPRNLPGQRPREQRSGVKVLAKECWHKERPKPKAARVVKVSQKLVRQGRWGEEMELEMPLFLSKLVSSNSFKIPILPKIIWQGKAGGKGTTGSGPVAAQQAPPSGLRLPLATGQQDFWLSLVEVRSYHFDLHPKAALGHIRSYWIVFCRSDNIWGNIG